MGREATVGRGGSFALAGLAVAVALLVAGVGAPGAGAAERPPNFVHVMTDDQTIDSMRHMPRLRRVLARKGTVFTNNNAVTPLCCPSRATFLTGQYTHNHGVIHNAPPFGFQGLDFRRTIYTAMQGAGYRTGWIGKVLNAPGRVAVDPQPGFDEWLVPVGETQHDMFDYTLSDNGVETLIEGRHQNPLYLERALQFLRATDGRPFLLTLASFTPHFTVCPREDPDEEHTYCPPEPVPADRGSFAGERFPFGPDFEGGPAERMTANRWWRRELESLQSVDRAVAALVRELRRLGELDRTYVIFQSDNGFLHGEHGIDYKKNAPWERSLRIPMVIRGPGFEPRGGGRPTRRRDLTANVDLPATILDAAGVEPPLPLDGHSLLGGRERRTLLFERLNGPVFAGVKTAGNWSYWEGKGRFADRHLYDLDADPYQLRNLVRREPRRAARLAQRLERARTCAAPCP